MKIHHGLCEGCGAAVKPEEIQPYGSQFCHVVAVDDDHGEPEPAPCGPVRRFVDIEQPLEDQVKRSYDLSRLIKKRLPRLMTWEADGLAAATVSITLEKAK